MDCTREKTLQEVTSVALMVTRRCNMSCGHCSVESHPKLASGPELAVLLERIEALADVGVSYVLLTGGEPMLRKEIVLELLRRGSQRGLVMGLYSNGFWGKKPEVAEGILKELKTAGLSNLALSFDRFHADFQSVEPVIHIARAAQQLQISVRVSITRSRHEESLEPALEKLARLDGVPIRFYDLQPVGSAKALATDEFRAEVEGACNACGFLAITEDGRVTACNGPSYFEKKPSPLAVGSLAEDSMSDLVNRFSQDPVTSAIRTTGPLGLVKLAQTLPELKDVAWPASFSGMCQACHFLCAQPNIVEALRRNLSEEAQAARQVALRRVLEGSMRGGQLDSRVLNGPAQVRATLELDQVHDHIWGRADFRWKEWMEQVIDQGFSLWVEAHQARLKRWAPEWILAQIKSQARASAVRHLMLKDCLRRLAHECQTLGLRPVLLKGAAMIAQNPDGLSRIPGDIDLWLPPEQAVILRRHLLRNGWQGPSEDSEGAAHHLACVTWKNIPVEIHHRLMPEFWGLPESEMLATARPLPAFPALQVMSQEAQLVHTMVHCSKHLLIQGLKCGWDLRWLSRSGWDPAVVVDFASRLRFPQSFWIPLFHLSQPLGLTLPQGLPRFRQDRRQRWLGKIAFQQLFGLRQRQVPSNPLLRLGLYALLADTWRQRLGLVFRIVGGDSAESAQAQRLGWRRLNWGEARRCLQEAWLALRMLRSTP